MAHRDSFPKDEWLGIGVVGTCFHLGYVKYRIHDGEQMVAGLADQRDILLLPRIFEAAKKHLVQQQVGESNYGIQRRAQFMADGGKEPAFRNLHASIGLGRGRQSGAQGRHLVICPDDGGDFPFGVGRSHHLDQERPVVSGAAALAGARNPETHLYALEITALAKIGQRAHVDYAVGDMHPVEQPAGEQKFGGYAQAIFRAWRDASETSPVSAIRTTTPSMI